MTNFPTSTAECPKCGGQGRNTGLGSGQMSSTYARFETKYECQDCGNWFSKVRKYDKTSATEASLRALRQAYGGEMNEYGSVDEMIEDARHP